MTQQSSYGTPTSRVGITTALVAPFDRVRWGPILAGLFAALSTLTILSVLGLAVGLSAWDPGDNARNYSWGAGIWSIISALISFYVGGWLAARSAAAAGERNGLLNGAMVWAVAIPLLLFLLGGSFGSLAHSAVSGGMRVSVLEGTNTFDRAQTAGARMGDGMSADTANLPNTEQAAHSAARAAWWTLISLVLGLCAAGVGGLAGARGPSDYTTVESGTTGPAGTAT